MLNYWFKLKGVIVSLLVFFVTNAYLIYILSKYVADKTTGYLIVLITNEIFIFIGVLFYMVYDVRLRLNDKMEELEYIIKKK